MRTCIRQLFFLRIKQSFTEAIVSCVSQFEINETFCIQMSTEKNAWNWEKAEKKPKLAKCSELNLLQWGYHRLKAAPCSVSEPHSVQGLLVVTALSEYFSRMQQVNRIIQEQTVF